MPEFKDIGGKGEETAAAGNTDWLKASKETHRPLFSELDVLLKALDRFLSSGARAQGPADRNLRRELAAVRDAVLRVIGILDAVIPEDKKNAYWFRKYAEAKLMAERERRRFREETYRQDTPEKSLYILYDSFITLKGVITDLLRNPTITYTGFANIADVISRHIRDNVHFNPFRQDINPEFDIIENRTVSEMVKNIGDRETRKTVSVIFLELFRLLRYLRHLDLSSPRSTALHSSMLILLLVKEEIESLRTHIEGLSERPSPDGGPALGPLFESLSYQFLMESKRVFSQEMKDILEKKSSQQVRGRLENSHGILKNLAEQAVIQIAQLWRPEVRGEEIFSSFTTKLEQSLKLRQDIYVLERLLSEFEKAVSSGAGDKNDSLFRALGNYISYFESFTFKLLRHDDYEEFASFFDWLSRLGAYKPGDGACKPSRRIENPKGGLTSLIERCRHFRIYLETTLRHIGNRAELAGRPLDTAKTEDIIRQYLEA